MAYALAIIRICIDHLLFMIFMLKIIESRKPMTVLLWSSLTAISFYFLFEMLLEIAATQRNIRNVKGRRNGFLNNFQMAFSVALDR